jgi:predicted unusual protein kinase regulating ubiquinone biosynthesis (AarF/ABC1/UbiB family)
MNLHRSGADPHPGNVMLVRSEDGTPQIGLIDYGSTKQISKEMRHLFCKIVIALANDDRDEIAKLMTKAGFRSDKMDPEVIYLYTKVHYDEDNEELTGGKHVQLFVEDLQARDPIRAIPEDFCLISAASIRLRGLAHAVHQPRSLAKEWKKIAAQVLRVDI